MKNVEWVEVQPFHQLGAFKWKAMGLDYKLADTPTAEPRSDQPGDRTIPRRGLPGALTVNIRPIRGSADTCSILLATSSAASRS